MSPLLVARVIGAGRLLIGLVLIAQPKRGTSAWIGADADRAGAQVLTRAVGVRDFLLGFLTLHVAAQPGVGKRTEIDRMMRRIEDEASRMGSLVDDLLLLARLDQHRPLAHERVDLTSLVDDAVGDARAVAPSRKIHAEIGAHSAVGVVTSASGGGSGSVPPIVVGDEPRLRQVVANLMSNALTHTPETASIRVRLDVRPPCAVLEVTDTGPGLAPSDAARVFERFYRVETSRSRANGGSGLGLSIAAALVAAQGGTIDLETSEGAGATFRVRLPLADDQFVADFGS